MLVRTLWKLAEQARDEQTQLTGAAAILNEMGAFDAARTAGRVANSLGYIANKIDAIADASTDMRQRTYAECDAMCARMAHDHFTKAKAHEGTNRAESATYLACAKAYEVYRARVVAIFQNL